MVSGGCLLPTWMNQISHTSCQESWACPHSLSSLMPLQMGSWTESPGYVCATTKTGCNILHALIDGDAVLHLHVMLDCFMTPNTPVQQQTRPYTKRPSVSITKNMPQLRTALALPSNRQVGQPCLHTIHGLFPLLSQLGHQDGKDPISRKKLDAGDACWAPSKELLDFVCDGRACKVHLIYRKALAIATTCHNTLCSRKLDNPPKVPVYPWMNAPCSHNFASCTCPLHPSEEHGQPAFITLRAMGGVQAALLDLEQPLLPAQLIMSWKSCPSQPQTTTLATAVMQVPSLVVTVCGLHPLRGNPCGLVVNM